jgi:hypothetical protein
VSAIALVTTTVNVPRVLELYREIGPDVRFHVVGDVQTPHAEVRAFVEGLGNAVYWSDDDQRALGYASSEAIGWRHPARRNIGMLEAVKEGADLVVTIDDDNIPLDRDYFRHFAAVLTAPFSGLEVTREDGWFDGGSLLSPPARQRGLPPEVWHSTAPVRVRHVVGAHVGVAAGLCLGDPDTDAVTRMAQRPLCLAMSDVGRAGAVVDPSCWAPYNSQNTCFRAELLPAMAMLSPVGRYDDIWAGLVTQRVMRAHDLRVHFGPPGVWQERNAHAALRDLQAELLGLADTVEFTRMLDGVDVDGLSVADGVERIYDAIEKSPWADTGLCELGRAWLRDARMVQAAARQ